MRAARPITYDKALARMEALCARSEQCSYDIMTKLLRTGLSRDDIDRVMQSLTERRFVDDARFAAAYVRDKYRFARWGRRKIAMGLRTKRIDSGTVGHALEEAVDQDEYVSVLRDLLRAKARTIAEGNSYEGRTKLFRFAASRGYETDLIVRQIKSDGSLWPV